MLRWRNLVQATKHQIYISQSHDPFLNLSIEHFLLQKSHPESTVLFLYVNSPCVVIGRNQNPWLEVDLQLLKQSTGVSNALLRDSGNGTSEEGSPGKCVQLVRRRSGGGAVFHDEGNVNYSVICPSAHFTRDKHAEMVTRAIRLINARARVNERHDIVLDQGRWRDDERPHAANTFHKSNFYNEVTPPLKVSGSAYKMTRQRCLHHGTCLLTSPNLASISQYLKSPARPFLKARGVESVRSPIGNVFEGGRGPTKNTNHRFQVQVINAFRQMYDIDKEALHVFQQNAPPRNDDQRLFESFDSQWVAGFVGDGQGSTTEIDEGMNEMKSSKWLFNQTPQFTMSSHANEEDDRERPPLPDYFPQQARVYLKARAGVITESKISFSSDKETAEKEAETIHQLLQEKNIYDFESFEDVLDQAGLTEKSHEVSGVSQWLNIMFGKES